MITVMRNKFKTTGMSYIVWISLISMFIGSVFPSLFKKESCEPWAIKVNNNDITYRSFMTELGKNREYITRLRAQYGQFADYFLHNMGVKDAQSFTFKQLITQELLAQAMKKTGIHIGAKYIAYKLHDVEFATRYCADIMPIQHVMTSQGIDTKILRSYLQHRGIPLEFFQKQLQEKVHNWFFNNLISTFLYTPEYITKYELAQKTGKKSYSIIHFNNDTFLQETHKTALTQEEITTYFEQHKSSYRVPEKRNGMQYTFSPKEYGVVVDAEAIEKYYEQHKMQKYIATPAQLRVRQLVIAFEPTTQQEAKKTIDTLHAQLTANKEQFETLARQYSTDKETAERGGEMQPFARGQKEQAFDRAAFILKQDGDISPVVELEHAYVIIQRIAKDPQTYKPLKEVSHTIEQELITKEFARIFAREAKEALDAQDQITIEEFIKNHRGTSTQLKQVTRAEKGHAKPLFELKENKYAFYLEGPKGFIVRLDTIEPAYIPTLDAIQKTVTDTLYQERATKLLDGKIQDVRTQAQNKPFAIVAQEALLQLDRIKGLSSKNMDDFKELRSKGLDPRALLEMEKIGSFTVQNNGFDRYLIRLDEITEDEQEVTQETITQNNKQVKGQQNNAFVGSFIASLYRDATIDINNAVTMFEEENSI